MKGSQPEITRCHGLFPRLTHVRKRRRLCSGNHWRRELLFWVLRHGFPSELDCHPFPFQNLLFTIMVPKPFFSNCLVLGITTDFCYTSGCFFKVRNSWTNFIGSKCRKLGLKIAFSAWIRGVPHPLCRLLLPVGYSTGSRLPFPASAAEHLSTRLAGSSRWSGWELNVCILEVYFFPYFDHYLSFLVRNDREIDYLEFGK